MWLQRGPAWSGSQPCPLGLGLSRGHEQRQFPSYCLGLAFKGMPATTVTPPATTARRPPDLLTGPRPSACTLGNWIGVQEKSVLLKPPPYQFLLSHFSNFPRMRRDLHLRLPLGFFLPQLGIRISRVAGQSGGSGSACSGQISPAPEALASFALPAWYPDPEGPARTGLGLLPAVGF